MVMKTLVLIFILSLNVYASSKSFKYYSDGIYDAYSEIENSLKDGLETKSLNSFERKWLVLQDVSSDSTVQLIFYQAIAHKNNFFSAVISKDMTNNQSYMVYGAFSRKADAIYAQKRLKEQAINAKVVFSDSGKKYVSNPIVVKKLIIDMEKLLRDTPVLVVMEKEILSSSKTAKCEPEKTFSLDVKKENAKLKQKMLDNIASVAFLKIQKLWKTRGAFSKHLRYVSFVENRGRMNRFYVGDNFKGFKVIKIYNKRKSNFHVLKLLGINGKKYKIYAKWRKTTKKKIVPIRNKNKIQIKIKKKIHKSKTNAKEVKAGKGDIYFCDFSKIKVAKFDGKLIDVSNTTYGNQRLKVKITHISKDYKVEYSGYRTIYINKFYFKKCKRQ